MDETIVVEVGEDHLAAFRRSPKVAIAELIWNGLDADATEVVVEYELNALDGIDVVTVRDNGSGMTASDASFGFRNFGNSWKRKATHTQGGRALHGKLGRNKRYSLWVRNWAEVLGDATHRHKFVQKSLDYTTNHDSGVVYLREKHQQYLPDILLADEELDAQINPAQ